MAGAGSTLGPASSRYEPRPDMTKLVQPLTASIRTAPRPTRPAITIGLINNMGDEALKITERQFAGLVSVSATGIDIQLRLFALNRMPRSARALEYMSSCYEPGDSVIRGDLDGLIITGAQP